MGITEVWARSLFNLTELSLTEQCNLAHTSRRSSWTVDYTGCHLGMMGDEGGDDESGCLFLWKTPTFTSSLLLLLLLCVSLKRNSMQIPPSEDKIPVSIHPPALCCSPPFSFEFSSLTNLCQQLLHDPLSALIAIMYFHYCCCRGESFTQ